MAVFFAGVASEGFTGLFTGLGKGLVGTVTKPAVGMLDLATGAASAVRDSSRSASKETPKRIRPPRLVVGPGGTLPRYSENQGRGQELLFQINKHRYKVQSIISSFMNIPNFTYNFRRKLSSLTKRLVRNQALFTCLYQASTSEYLASAAQAKRSSSIYTYPSYTLANRSQ